MKTKEQIAKELDISVEDIFTPKEFLIICDCGSIMASDGHGYFHDGEKELNISVWNNTLTWEDVQKYPYICWYNK